MCTSSELHAIAARLGRELAALFCGDVPEIILFGSHARGDADEGSDIDLLVLLDVPREQIADKHWQIGEIAAELLLEYGIVVSPIVENRAYFLSRLPFLPFYQTIEREGVRLIA